MPDATDKQRDTPPRRNFLRRHWLLATSLILLVALRLALPYVLPGVLADQLSKAIRGEVKIGAVDLALLRGAVGIDDIGVFAENEADKPVIALRRLSFDLSWRALLRRQVVLEELLIADPRVAVDRLADGEISLARLIPASAPQGAPAASQGAEESGPGWSLGVERFVLDGGNLQFTDRGTAGRVTLPLVVDQFSVQRAAYGNGIYDDAATFQMAGQLAGAPWSGEGRFKLVGDDVQGSVAVTARSVPIGWVRPYIDRAWSHLDGAVDLNLSYEIEPRTRNHLHGTVTAKGVTVQVGEVSALAFDLAVALDDVNLIRRHAALGSVRVSAAHLVVRPREDPPLPILLARGAAAADESAGGAADDGTAGAEKLSGEAEAVAAVPAEPAEAAAVPAEPAEAAAVPAEPAEAAAVPAEPAEAAAVPAEPAEAAAVPAEPAEVAAVPAEPAEVAAVPAEPAEAAAVPAEPPEVAAVAPADAPGSAAPAEEAAWHWSVVELTVADTKVSVQIPEHELEVGVEIAASELSGEAAAEIPVRLALSLGTGTLVVEGKARRSPQSFAGGATWKEIDIPSLLVFTPAPLDKIVAAASTQGDLKVALQGETIETSGTLAVDGLRVASADEREFAAGLAALRVAIGQIRIAPDAVPLLRIDRIEMLKPDLQLTRRLKGIVLPQLQGAAPPSDTAAPPPAAAGADRPAADLRIAALRIDDGRIRFRDRALKARLGDELRQVSLSADSLAWPPTTVGHFDLAAVRPSGGTLKASGRITSGGTAAEVDLSEWSLPEYDSYAVTYSGYGIEQGRLSLQSKITIAGKSFKADTGLTLRELGVDSGGSSLFQDRFGIPISVALELLRDSDGTISLDLPLSGSTDAPGVEIVSVIRRTLQRVLANALVAPLKLVGAVVDQAGRIAGVSARPVAFAPGGAVLDGTNAESVGAIVSLLKKRPGLRAVVRGVVVEGDLAPLARAALREELEDDAKALPDGDDVLAYLRDGGDVEDLGKDARVAMEKRLADLAASEETRRSLAKARADAVRQALRETEGIAAGRVGVLRASGRLRAGEPRAEIELGAQGMKGTLSSMLAPLGGG